MDNYYFIGSHCEIDNRIELNRLGQKVCLSPEVASIVIAGGGAILPEHIWEQLSFTPEELSDYAFPGQRATAPAAFLEKYQAALTAYHDLAKGGA